MQQEINLYLLLPAQKKSVLTFQRMVLAYGIFFVLLVLHFIGDLWEEHKERIQVDNTTLALSQVERSLDQIHAQYPMLDLKDMESSLKILQGELEQKNSVFNLLSQNQNFSTYLLGVARAAVPNLWLLDIQVEMGPRDLTLKGYALDSNAIQQFMNQLTLQKEFSGLNFQLREVNKAQLHQDVLYAFTISSKVNSEKTT